MCDQIFKKQTVLLWLHGNSSTLKITSFIFLTGQLNAFEARRLDSMCGYMERENDRKEKDAMIFVGIL
jgi:hypothetical protein